MSVEDQVELDTITETTAEVENTTETEGTVVDTETESREPEYSEYEQKMFERAKRAEAEVRELKDKLQQPPTAPQATPATPQGLDSFDTIALIEAKVTNREDIATVIDYARFKGISVTEALKSSVMKAELRDKAELRQSAELANTGRTRRSNSQVSDETLIANADKGILPESDDDLARMVAARAKRKR